jgi:hypothetical protein
MTFDRASAPGRSADRAASSAAFETPGKRTRVDALPSFGGSAGAGHHDHARHGPAEDAEHDHAAPGHDAGAEGVQAARPGAADADAGEVESMAGGEAEGGESAAGEEGTEESPSEEGPAVGGASEPAPAPADGAARPPVGHASRVDPPVAQKLAITSKTVHSAPGGAPDTRTKVAVGEDVRLVGSLAGSWSADHGTARGEAGRHFTWTAPATPGTATITLSTGIQTATRKFRIIAPNHLSMKLRSVDHFPAGTQGAGMKTDVTIGPSSVSFGNCEWLEVGGPPSNITGYFATHKHLHHHPNPKWLGWNHKNTGLWDHAWLARFPPPWTPGGFQWTIPNKWRVAKTGGNGHVFFTTHQVFKITNRKGTTTISKGGAHVSRTP